MRVYRRLACSSVEQGFRLASPIETAEVRHRANFRLETAQSYDSSVPFIGGRKSRHGQVRLVDAFLAMRSELSETRSDWKGQRRLVAASYRIMSDALHEVRADDGKTTQPHHYANEARLLNWIMFDKFESVDRDQLSPSDLALLEMLEARNAIWIARGRTYQERKTALQGYLRAARTTPSARLQ